MECRTAFRCVRRSDGDTQDAHTDLALRRHRKRAVRRITRLPEYYPARTEQSILDRWAPEMVAITGPDTLVELDSGTSDKTRSLLDAMAMTGALRRSVPFGVADATLREASNRIAADYAMRCVAWWATPSPPRRGSDRRRAPVRVSRRHDRQLRACRAGGVVVTDRCGHGPRLPSRGGRGRRVQRQVHGQPVRAARQLPRHAARPRPRHLFATSSPPTPAGCLPGSASPATSPRSSTPRADGDVRAS